MVNICSKSLALVLITWMLINAAVSIPLASKANGDVELIAKFAAEGAGLQFAGMTGSPQPPLSGGMMSSPPPPPPGGVSGNPRAPSPGSRPGGPPGGPPPPNTTTASSG